MDKICAVSLLLAIILAIVVAFAAIPDSAAILLVLGAISALNTAERPELRVRIYLAALVLTLTAKALNDVPAVGAQLAAIFAGIGTAFVGASMVAIVLAVARLIRANLMTKAA